MERWRDGGEEGGVKRYNENMCYHHKGVVSFKRLTSPQDQTGFASQSCYSIATYSLSLSLSLSRSLALSLPRSVSFSLSQTLSLSLSHRPRGLISTLLFSRLLWEPSLTEWGADTVDDGQIIELNPFVRSLFVPVVGSINNNIAVL